MSDQTFADEVLASFAAAGRYNDADREGPRAILWPDPENRWANLIPDLRRSRPILTLGDFEAEDETGPAIWIRWRLVQFETQQPYGGLPIVYLPGVDRTELRAIESTSDSLRQLADLQFRSSWWTQSNGSAWTPSGFARSPDGAHLDVARDAATKAAFSSALRQLGAMTMSSLRARGQLNSTFLNDLLVGDLIKALLDWLNEPLTHEAFPQPERSAFVSACKVKFGFDPDSDGPIGAGARLGERSGEWAAAWNRFSEAPASYPNIPGLLEQAKPADALMPLHPDSWPQDNRLGEDELREALNELHGVSAVQARERIKTLARDHRSRVESVWAVLGEAPLAKSLQHLLTIATLAEKVTPMTSLDEFDDWYRLQGVNGDDALLKAIAESREPADRSAVTVALRSIYLPWADTNARTFQTLVHETPLGRPAPIVIADGECVLFIDGLRLDVANRLASLLESRGNTVERERRYAPIPSMTASGKPAVAPIAAHLAGGTEFYPSHADKDLKSDPLKALMSQEGVNCFADGLGSSAGRGWTEAANIDKRGHDLKVNLADDVDGELNGIAARVRELLAGGWRLVHVVTDHGWLLMPGGLPKVELSIHTADSRKTRCARLGSHVGAIDQPDFRWTWDEDVRIAVPHGIAAFEAGCFYEHGGVSPQETIIPYFIVGAESSTSTTSISDVIWKQQRAKISVVGATSASVQVRLRPADASSAISEAKVLDESGSVSLLVTDDAHDGKSVFVVVVASDGALLAQVSTTVGG